MASATILSDHPGPVLAAALAYLPDPDGIIEAVVIPAKVRPGKDIPSYERECQINGVDITFSLQMRHFLQHDAPSTILTCIAHFPCNDLHGCLIESVVITNHDQKVSSWDGITIPGIISETHQSLTLGAKTDDIIDCNGVLKVIAGRTIQNIMPFRETTGTPHIQMVLNQSPREETIRSALFGEA